jgi:hypothetical protein
MCVTDLQFNNDFQISNVYTPRTLIGTTGI